MAAIGLFIGTLAADRAAYRGEFGLPGWVISGSADAARQILTTIAAAIITVVGVVFSIILVTLTLASTQFGPRMLRNFIRDRGTQLTLGTFVATFVYAVLVLASIGTGSHGDFVPHISVTITLGLTVIDLAVLIYFIHHTSISIQLPQVIASIAGDLAEAIREQGSGPDRLGLEAGLATVELVNRTEASGAVLLAPVSGYVQFIKHQNLVRLADQGRRGDQPGTPARALHRPRPPVRHGLAAGGRAAGAAGDGPGAHHRPATDADPGRVVRLRPAGGDRDPRPFPAVNDPFTAMTCIDWLSENLCKIVGRMASGPRAPGRAGYIRVITAEPSYDRLVQRSFEKIRQSAWACPRS